MQLKRTILASLLTLTAATAAHAIKAPDSDVSFRGTAQVSIAGQTTSMRCTGVGLREKAWVNVYAIASYVAEGEKPSGAAGLAAADVPKMLHLVMEREVSGEKMADAFVDAIRANHGSGFGSEIAKLKGFLQGKAAAKGEDIKFIHTPGKGLKVTRRGGSIDIDGVGFSKAVWEIYLGSKNVGSDIKKGLLKSL